MTKNINDIIYYNLKKVIMFTISKILDATNSPQYESHIYVWLLSIFSVIILSLSMIQTSSSSFVEINFPLQHQQIPLNTLMNNLGTSEDNKYSKCKVMTVVNKEFPYREATPIDNFGQGDYSKWSFILTPDYTKLQPGDNKITSKAVCDEFHRTLVKDTVTGLYIKHSGVNVTGMINSAR